MMKPNTWDIDLLSKLGPIAEYSQLRLSRISGDLTNHFDLDKI